MKTSFGILVALVSIAFLMFVFNLQYSKVHSSTSFGVKSMSDAYHQQIQVENKEIIEEFMQRYSDIHERRINYTRKICGIQKKRIPRLKTKPVLLVDEKHKMVYCPTPKTGADSWCRAMLILSEYKKREMVMKMSTFEANAACEEQQQPLSSYPVEKQKQIMDTYTKFMFVRHPLSRILSAFNDKVSTKDSKIDIPRFRNSTGKLTWTSTSNTVDITFQEFIDMLITVKPTEKFLWNEMHLTCSVCDMNYDIIGHFEDMYNDAKYILRLLGVSDLKFPSAYKKSTNAEELRQAFSSVTTPGIAELYHKYKYDFELFGYEIPLNAGG